MQRASGVLFVLSAPRIRGLSASMDKAIFPPNGFRRSSQRV